MGAILIIIILLLLFIVLDEDVVVRDTKNKKEINLTDKLKEIIEKIKKIEEMGYKNLQVCIAKTQYSFSDNAKDLECNDSFEINIRDVELKAGAGFVVVLAGKIMTMPGLPKVPAAENINIDENGEIEGIF